MLATLLSLFMSDRQKLFLTWVLDTVGIIVLLHVYPFYLVIAIGCLGIGALIVLGQEWWRYQFCAAKHPCNSTPESLTDGFQQPVYYPWMSELDALELDLCDSSIGDPTCKYNAHSPYIRCAVNPHLNTCEDCQHYE
jgi:hypothetical protein